MAKQTLSALHNHSGTIQSDIAGDFPGNGRKDKRLGGKYDLSNPVNSEGVSGSALSAEPGGRIGRVGDGYGGEYSQRPDGGGRGVSSADPTLKRLVSGDLVDEKFDSYKIDVKDLGAWWRLVRPGVENVIEKTRPSFIPEDVYSSLKQDHSWLIVTLDKENKEYAGFVIVSRANPDQFSGRQDLLIWLAYSEIKGAVESTLPKVELLGKKMGFNYAIFHSSRKGWERRAKNLGFKVREVIYSKKL